MQSRSNLQNNATTNKNKHKNKKQRNRSVKTSQQNKQNKKRKHHDREDNTTNNLSQILSTISKKCQSPPKKKQKILKRSSKKPTISHTTQPNSHITITFANINGTIDAIILPTQNVLAMNSDILLENKGKLSIKTSDPIQNDITPQIPINIKILKKTPNIKTIHPRNSFRMGTSLFYCSDEERLFWSFPLRNTRRVSCQHYCCAVSKIVTRSVGIHSNKCNGNHSEHTPCIYAVCNGKPPKGIIPAKLFANYQYFQHSAKTELLVPKDPNDEKFKKVPNTNNNSTMYQNIKVIPLHPNITDGPPPLSPMNDTHNSYKNIKHKYIKNKLHTIKQENSRNIKKEMQIDSIKSETDSTKRRRPQNTNNGEPIPFQQNVQIDLKALSEKKQKLRANASNITTSSSISTEPESHDYSELLLHSTSSVIRDAENESRTGIEPVREHERVSNRKKCKQLLMCGEFDQVIALLKPFIQAQDFPGFPAAKTKSRNSKKLSRNSATKQEITVNKKLNECRLLMATALYYRDDSSAALHFCNLIVSNCLKNEGDIQYYEARKIRGLIHKKLRNYKAAVHDFEFICYNNPYHKTWRDQLYANRGKSNFLENKVMSTKNHHRPSPIRHRLLQQGRPNMYQMNLPPNIANMPPPPPPFHPNKMRLNEIITTHHHHNHNINVLQNNNYFPPPNQPIFPVMQGRLLSNQTIDPDALNILAQSMVDTAMNSSVKSPPMDITNPNAPIIFIPPIMDRKSNSNSGRNTPTNSTQKAQNKANKLGINLSDFHIPPNETKRKANPNSNTIAKTLDPSILDVNYSDLSISQLPKGFPERSSSNTSFEGLIALAHAASNEYDKKQEKKEEKEEPQEQEQVMNAEDLLKDLNGFTAMKRKTTREELLGEQFMNLNSSNDANYNTNTSINERKDINDDNLSSNFPNMPSLHKTVSTTPEPLERIRSDALARNSSQ